MNIIICHGVQRPKGVDDLFKVAANTGNLKNLTDFAPNLQNSANFDPMNDWKRWLQDKLTSEYNIDVQAPLFPGPNFLDMQYDKWETVMDVQNINNDTVLIGHSAGGGFVLKYMATHPEITVRQIVLVAPWIDAEHLQPRKFYDGLNLNNDIATRSKFGIDILVSQDDGVFIQNSVKTITKSISDAKLHTYKDYGHFTCPELPEILRIIKLHEMMF